MSFDTDTQYKRAWVRKCEFTLSVKESVTLLFSAFVALLFVYAIRYDAAHATKKPPAAKPSIWEVKSYQSRVKNKPLINRFPNKECSKRKETLNDPISCDRMWIVDVFEVRCWWWRRYLKMDRKRLTLGSQFVRSPPEFAPQLIREYSRDRVWWALTNGKKVVFILLDCGNEIVF